MPGAEEELKQMGQVFADSSAVQARIQDPQAVWSELSQPNRTGIETLLERVKPAAHPALKLACAKTLLTRSICGAVRDLRAQRHVAGDF